MIIDRVESPTTDQRLDHALVDFLLVSAAAKVVQILERTTFGTLGHDHVDCAFAHPLDRT
ncbi:hypothetical protein D3C72_2477560 [compost metagenome]